MWILARDGFVSLVEHNEKPDYIRARARRFDHLQDTFSLQDGDIIDLGPDAPDYRFHADVPKTHVAQKMYEAVMDIDYDSHVKENVSGRDNVMYSAMMSCWSALYRLQDEPATQPYVVMPRSHADVPITAFGDDNPTLADLGDIATQVGKLAEKMVAAVNDPDAFGGYADDVDFEPDHKPIPGPMAPLEVLLWGSDEDECLICGEGFNTGDRYVTLPEDVEFHEPEGPAHAVCADEEGWEIEVETR